MFFYILSIILNNATFSGIVTITLGAFLAGKIYRKQKDIDREYKNEEKIAESLMILEEHCRAVNQSIDRLSNTYKLIIEESNKERIEGFIKKRTGYRFAAPAVYRAATLARTPSEAGL